MKYLTHSWPGLQPQVWIVGHDNTEGNVLFLHISAPGATLTFIKNESLYRKQGPAVRRVRGPILGLPQDPL